MGKEYEQTFFSIDEIQMAVKHVKNFSGSLANHGTANEKQNEVSPHSS